MRHDSKQFQELWDSWEARKPKDISEANARAIVEALEILATHNLTTITKVALEMYKDSKYMLTCCDKDDDIYLGWILNKCERKLSVLFNIYAKQWYS